LGLADRAARKSGRLNRHRACALGLAFAACSWAWADPPSGYYDGAAGLTGAALRQALHEIIDNHRAHPYSAAEGFVKTLDEDPTTSGNVVLIYNAASVPKSSWPAFNREHLWPQSLGTLRHPAKSDMHHIFAADAGVNSARGNKYFDGCTANCRTHAEAPQAPYDTDSWEPPDRDKGDIARAMFYMDVRYEGDGGEPDLRLTNDVPNPGCDCMGRLDVLLEWHRQDAPDDRERRRNDRVFSEIQGNRNPFVDHPEWASLIWGGPAAPVPTPTPPPGGAELVRLRATHHEGVPLHPGPLAGASFERVPDGTVVTVIGRADGGHWLNIRTPAGRAGWIIERYVGETISGGPGAPPAPPPPGTEREPEVWESATSCRQALQAGSRMARSDLTSVRLGTWNVRWFPKGCSPNESCPENATDVDWLACTIAWMDVDVLGLEEVTATTAASSALQSLINELDHLTGGSWNVDLQTCGGQTAQHVGFLWDAARVTLQDFADVWEMNGAASGPGGECAGNLRPGRYARVGAPGGGVDFQVVAVHFDSGTSERDYANRRTALGRLATISRGGQLLSVSDRDVVVLGDINTMGRGDAPEISAAAEVAGLSGEIAPDFRPVEQNPSCSEYFRGEAGLLDHILVATGMEEAPSAARVTGYCAVKNCLGIQGAMPAAYETLSDHCPQVLDLRNSDID